MTADEGADSRKNSLEVQLVERVQNSGIGSGEFQDHKSPSRREHATNFGERRIEAGDISYSKRDNRTRHRLSGEWQVQRVRGDRGNLRSPNLPAPGSQHRL